MRPIWSNIDADSPPSLELSQRALHAAGLERENQMKR